MELTAAGPSSPARTRAASRSATTSSASRDAARKVASTTYVAPCSRWAGPKTSPRRLWATIMWSRTVTLNNGLPLAVGDGVAQRPEAAVGQAPEGLREVVEGRAPGHQGVERRVLEEVQRQRKAVGRRAAAPPPPGDGPDLARPDRQATRVEGAAQSQVHLGVAVPAQLHNCSLRRQQVE